MRPWGNAEHKKLNMALLLLLVLSLLDVGGRSISRIIFAVWSACYGLIF